jgi:hypothetical protein
MVFTQQVDPVVHVVGMTWPLLQVTVVQTSVSMYCGRVPHTVYPHSVQLVGYAVASGQLDGVWYPGATVTQTVSVSQTTTSTHPQTFLPAETTPARANAAAEKSENFIPLNERA